jgi:hypothetical protein
LVTVADLFAVMSRMEFYEADVVFDRDRAEDRRPHAPTTRPELPARLIETLVRPLEASASFGRSRGSGRGIHRLVRPGFGKRRVSQHPPEEEAANNRVNQCRQSGELRRPARSHVRRLLEGSGDVLDDLAGRPLPRGTRNGPPWTTPLARLNHILRRIAKNAAEHGVEHRVVFGFSYQNAGQLVEFLKTHRHDLRQVTGVRYSGELGHPFHVVDDETVVLPLDHPFVKEGRFASLLVRDRELADSLAEGFHELWRKAMKSLREIQVDPRGHKRG